VNGILSALLLLIVSASPSAQPQLKLVHLRGNVYVVEDSYYSQENSAVYIGEEYVTVVGATWTPETAKRLADEIAKITKKPIREVIDTNYHPDRAGGNAYFRQIGARIVSTRMTYELLRSQGDAVAASTHKAIPAYTVPPLVLPDTIYDGSFDLQSGRVKGLYLGPSHTPDGIFVYFPEEKILYGNCILKENLGNLDYANLDEYPKTLLKLQQLQLGYTTIIAGHWSPVHGPELVDQYLELLRRHRESSALSH
jgi:metallo-beta-lactamase class B